MTGIVSGIATLLGLVLFVGIVWWAYSRGRAKANAEASLLPFALPDEESADTREGEGADQENKKSGSSRE